MWSEKKINNLYSARTRLEKTKCGKKFPLPLLADGLVSWIRSSALGGGQTQKGNVLLPEELATWTKLRTPLGNPPGWENSLGVFQFMEMPSHEHKVGENPGKPEREREG